MRCTQRAYLKHSVIFNPNLFLFNELDPTNIASKTHFLGVGNCEYDSLNLSHNKLAPYVFIS